MYTVHMNVQCKTKKCKGNKLRKLKENENKMKLEYKWRFHVFRHRYTFRQLLFLCLFSFVIFLLLIYIFKRRRTGFTFTKWTQIYDLIITISLINIIAMTQSLRHSNRLAKLIHFILIAAKTLYCGVRSHFFFSCFLLFSYSWLLYLWFDCSQF